MSHCIDMDMVMRNAPQSVDNALIEEISAIQIKMIEVLRENYRLKSELAHLKSGRLGPVGPIPLLGKQVPFAIQRSKPGLRSFQSDFQAPYPGKKLDVGNLTRSVNDMQTLIGSLDKKSHRVPQDFVDEIPRSSDLLIRFNEDVPLRTPVETLYIEERQPRGSVALKNKKSSADSVEPSKFIEKRPIQMEKAQTDDITNMVLSSAVGLDNMRDAAPELWKSIDFGELASKGVEESPAPPSMQLVLEEENSEMSESYSESSESSSDSLDESVYGSSKTSSNFALKNGTIRINATGLPISKSIDSLDGGSPLARMMKSSTNLTKIMLPEDDEPSPTD